MPSERPTRPSPTNRSMNSGRAASSSANSSTITSRSGIGGSDGSTRPARLVGDDVVDVAGLAQHRLAALLLADQRVAHAVDERQVALQVGDHARDVREPGELGERRAALVVDEHERQLLRVVRGGQAGHQRAQQLALARAGRADEHAVRAHAVLGRLLEVQPQHLAGGGAADRRAQRLGPRARRGAPARPRPRVVRAQQLDQPHAGPRPRSPSRPPSASRSGASVRAIASAMPEVDLVQAHLGDRRRVLAPDLPRAEAALGDGQARVDVRGLLLARRRSAARARP